MSTCSVEAPYIEYKMSALYSGGNVVSTIYWFSPGAPDFAGALAGFPAANLTQIAISSTRFVGPQIPAGTAVLVGPASGDLANCYPNPTVVGIDGIPINPTSTPSVGQALVFHSDGYLEWAAAGGGGGFTPGGDLSGNSTSQTVIGIQGVPVSSTPPSTSQVLSYNGTQWAPSSVAGSLVGDVTGPLSSNVVGAISSPNPIVIQQQEFIWSTPASPLLTQTAAFLGSGHPFSITAQNGQQSGNSTGGNIVLTPGLGHGSGSNGQVQIVASNMTGSGIVHCSSGFLFNTLITDADISASANLSVSKFAPGTSAQVLMNSSTPTPTWTTITGDVVLASTGATTVVALQGNAVKSQSLGSAQDGYALTWHNATSQWQALPEVGGGSGVTWAADLSGSTNSAQWVASISGSGGGGSAVGLHTTALQFDSSQATPTIIQLAPTIDVATNLMTIQSQDAWVSSSVNVNGGGLTLATGNAGTLGNFGPLTLSVGHGASATNVLTATASQTNVWGGFTSPSLVLTSSATTSQNAISYLKTTTGPGLSQATPTTDIATINMTIAAQSAFASASVHTGGANLILEGGAAAGAGTPGIVSIPSKVTMSAYGTGLLHSSSAGVLTSSTVVDADVSASAAVAVTKLAAGTSAQVLLNNSTPAPTWTTLSGDMTVSNAGATTVGKIQGGIALSGTPSSGQVLTATSSTAADWQTPSGGGSANPTVVTKTSAYTVSASNQVVLCNSSGAITITAPSPGTAGTFFYIKDITGNATANPITIAPNSSESFDGVAASVVFVTNWGSVGYVSNGSNWFSF